MFNDVVVNPGVGSREDAKLSQTMLMLAKKRAQDKSPTSDVHAAFKEGERAPVAGASL